MTTLNLGVGTEFENIDCKVFVVSYVAQTHSNSHLAMSVNSKYVSLNLATYKWILNPNFDGNLESCPYSMNLSPPVTWAV